MISEKDQERIARLKEQADKILVQVQELENKNMAASNSGIVLLVRTWPTITSGEAKLSTAVECVLGCSMLSE